MNSQRLSLISIFLIVASAAGSGAASAQHSDSLTVDEALTRALGSHPALEQSRAMIHLSETRALQSGLAARPEVTAEAGYTRLDPVSELSIPGLGSMKLFPENNFDAHIGVRSTLYDFGKTDAAIDVSRSRVRTAADQLELAKTGLAVQTQRAFYAILLLQRSIPVQDEQLEALKEHLRVTEKRVATGTATQFDVLTTQVRIASAETQRVDLVNALERQRAEFRRLVGLPEDAPVRVRGEFPDAAPVLTADTVAARALRERPESMLAHDAEATAVLQQQAAALGKAPAIRGAINYGFKNGYEPNFDVLRGNWSAALKVEVPVYDGGRTTLQEEEAEAALVAERAHTRDIERQIRSDVESALADVQAAGAKAKISDVQLRQAHEAVVIARTRYETGSVTNLDLLDAETAETVARHARLQALYRYVLSTVELDRARGRKY